MNKWMTTVVTYKEKGVSTFVVSSLDDQMLVSMLKIQKTDRFRESWEENEINESFKGIAFLWPWMDFYVEEYTAKLGKAENSLGLITE